MSRLACGTPSDVVGRAQPFRRLLVSLMVSLSLLVACITSPLGNTEVPAGTDRLSFAGTYPYNPERAATIQIEVRDGSAWVALGSPIAVTAENRWASPPLAIDPRFWTGPCEAAVFRARSSSGGLSPAGRDALCMEALGPTPTLEGVASCTRQHLVVRRRGPGVTYAPPSELVISTQTDAEMYGCVSVLDGDLTVRGGGRLTGASPPVSAARVTLTLPRLVAVTGAFGVFGERAERISLPALERVGTATTGMRGLTLVLNKFAVGTTIADIRTSVVDAPRLTRVGGLLTLQNANLDAANYDLNYDFGLPALVDVEDVRVENGPLPRSHMAGLPAVDTVHGTLTIRSEHWEITDPAILPALTRVEGDLVLQPGNQLTDTLRRLEVVTGNVRIEKIPGRFCAMTFVHVLENLRAVGGDFVVRGCRMVGACARRAFPMLTSVGRSLQILEEVTSSAVRFGAPGPTPLVLGALEISGSQVAEIPLANDVRLSTEGTVSVRDNAELCQCRVDAFTAALAAHWPGTPDVSGNKTCAPCPPPSCP